MMTACNENNNNTDQPTMMPTIAPTKEPERNFFSEIYKEGFMDADESSLSLLDEYAEYMRKNVLNTRSEYKVNDDSTVYYFSNSGSSINDGLSPQTPKSTLYDLQNNVKLKAGDVVLFERGSIFRGTFKARTGVTYSSYGEGAKPIICGSMRDYGSPGLWKESEYENVYICKKTINNAGNIVFDNTWVLGDYEQTLGNLRVLGLDGFTGPQDLNKDLDFYCDMCYYIGVPKGNTRGKTRKERLMFLCCLLFCFLFFNL